MRLTHQVHMRQYILNISMSRIKSLNYGQVARDQQNVINYFKCMNYSSEIIGEISEINLENRANSIWLLITLDESNSS